MGFLGLMTKKEAQAVAEAAVKAVLLKDAPRWLLPTADAEHFNLPDPSVYGNQADLFRKLSWVTQAVDIKAMSCAVTKFSVAKDIEGKEPEDIPNHPFELLLKRPNPLDNRFQFLYATSAFMDLTGNCYWWLNRESESTPPTELWILPSHMVQPIPDAQMYIKGYMYYPGNGREIFLEDHQIVHFRRFNPFSRFVGLSVIEAIAMTANGVLGMQEWNTQYFTQNNARLPGIISFEQMIDNEIWEKIKQDTREAAANRELMMLRGTGQGGVKWLQNSISQKDMEFIQGIQASGKEIMNTISPGLYAWLSGESTYSNANAARAAFDELSVYPRHVVISEEIVAKILPTYTRSAPSPQRKLTGYFEDVRFVDREQKLREEERFAATHTIEEIRQEFYGDEPLGDERDKLLPSQVNAQSGGIQKPPAPSPAQLAQANQMMDDKNGEPPMPKDEAMMEKEDPKQKEDKQDEEATNAMREELARYERKALKRIGQTVDFTSDILPTAVSDYVSKGLANCTNETAVKALFSNARGQLRQTRKAAPEDAATVLDGIRLALQALQTKQ